MRAPIIVFLLAALAILAITASPTDRLCIRESCTTDCCSPAFSDHLVWMPPLAEDFVLQDNTGGLILGLVGRIYGVIYSKTNNRKAFYIDLELSELTSYFTDNRELQTYCYEPKPVCGDHYFVPCNETEPTECDTHKKRSIHTVTPSCPYKINPTSWFGYNKVKGTFIGLRDYKGTEISVYQAKALQVGYGANNKNTNFGFSVWFYWRVVATVTPGMPSDKQHGDINADILCCDLDTCPLTVDVSPVGETIQYMYFLMHISLCGFETATTLEVTITSTSHGVVYNTFLGTYSGNQTEIYVRPHKVLSGLGTFVTVYSPDTGLKAKSKFFMLAASKESPLPTE